MIDDWSEIPETKNNSSSKPRRSRDAFRRTVLLSFTTALGAALAGDVWEWLKGLAVYLWKHVRIILID